MKHKGYISNCLVFPTDHTVNILFSSSSFYLLLLSHSFPFPYCILVYLPIFKQNQYGHHGWDKGAGGVTAPGTAVYGGVGGELQVLARDWQE